MLGARANPWLIALWGLAAPALAQSGTADITRENIEIMPFGGWRTGGGLAGELAGTGLNLGLKSGASYGGAVDFNLHGGNFKIEALYSRQSTELESGSGLVPAGLGLNVEYLQAGLLQETGSEKGRFYISALLGATRFDPEGFQSETKFSLSVGGGLKLFLNRHVGVRLDARAFLTFMQADTGAFCANGTCVFAYSGTNMWQGDFTAGLILAF